MKQALTLLILLIIFGPLPAQPAPDFTVTTSDGVIRSLYGDHLNQGQTVVLKIFFTTCPPCNAMAPLMEPFYQEWGGGAFEVEFISLSIMPFDSNSDVAAYKDQYGHTWPGAGSDGGSMDAIDLYSDGTYGPLLGTPTFIVIAPDGTVTFDPRGPTYEATLDSVAAAITATGARRPVLADVTGAVHFHHSSGDTLGVAGAVIHIPGLQQAVDTTGTDGQFQFSVRLLPGETYQLTTTKEDDHAAGVTTADLIPVLRQVLGLAPIPDPWQLLAADISLSQTVTTQDIIRMRKLILLPDYQLPEGMSWLFFDESFTFPADPFPPAQSGAANPELSTESTGPFFLRGIKLGDVNFSADPGN